MLKDAHIVRYRSASRATVVPYSNLLKTAPRAHGLPLNVAQVVPGATLDKVDYEFAERTQATAHGGIVMAHRVAVLSGLVAAIDMRVNVLKIHRPYHESDHVLNIAYNCAVTTKRFSMHWGPSRFRIRRRRATSAGASTSIRSRN